MAEQVVHKLQPVCDVHNEREKLEKSYKFFEEVSCRVSDPVNRLG